MKKIRFGIIGCAGIARRAFIPALQISDQAELTAVASRSMGKAEEFAQEFDCAAVNGYSALIDRADVDAVYIATPIALHAEWAIAAARAGKHVLCEKSLALNPEEVQQIIDTCQKNNVALFEGFAYQFHHQHAVVRDLVSQGKIGTPVQFQGWFGFPPINSPHRYDPALGGGSLMDAGCYPVHAARKFFGRKPVTVHAVLDQGAHQVDVHGSVLMDFGHGQTAQLTFGFDNVYRNSYSIWGTKGSITLTRAFAVPPTFAPTLILEQQSYREERILNPDHLFLGEIDAFCAGIGDSDFRQEWIRDALEQSKTLATIRQNSAAN